MKRPKSEDDTSAPLIQPPNTFTVPEPDRRPVLFYADGTPLVRKPAGFARER